MKEIFILSAYGKPVAVILAKGEKKLHDLVSIAITEETCADRDGQFELKIGRLGDIGETTEITVSYVNDGELITTNEFVLNKVVSYS
jgi:hypothetical protein